MSTRRVHSVGSNVENSIRFALFVGSDFFDSIGRIVECRIFDIRRALLHALNMKKIVKKFPQSLLTLKIANSRSNFISNISQVFRTLSYVVWCVEYLKNCNKIPADILDLENLYFKINDALKILFPLFFPFLAHQWS